VLLCAAGHGPTSSRGTFAASLASGRPVVAIDGPRTWSELVARDAARVVAPTPVALADELAAMLADRDLRDALGARGRALHEQRMAVARSAQTVAAIFRDLVARA
jgi:glycosyltransferase involved in cell wall biosynthesis